MCLGKFKSYRASVDSLWKHVTSVCVCVCVCLSLSGSLGFSHNLVGCEFQCGPFPVIKFHLAPAAVHGKELVAREDSGFVLFPVMWQQVWTGMQPAVNHYQCHPVFSLERSDFMLTHQPLSCLILKIKSCQNCVFPLSSTCKRSQFATVPNGIVPVNKRTGPVSAGQQSVAHVNDETVCCNHSSSSCPNMLPGSVFLVLNALILLLCFHCSSSRNHIEGTLY